MFSEQFSHLLFSSVTLKHGLLCFTETHLYTDIWEGGVEDSSVCGWYPVICHCPLAWWLWGSGKLTAQPSQDWLVMGFASQIQELEDFNLWFWMGWHYHVQAVCNSVALLSSEGCGFAQLCLVCQLHLFQDPEALLMVTHALIYPLTRCLFVCILP